MDDVSETKSSALNMVAIVVDGLRKTPDSNEPEDEEMSTEENYAERILVPMNDPLSVLWEKIECEYDLVLCAGNVSWCTGLTPLSSGLSTSRFATARGESMER